MNGERTGRPERVATRGGFIKAGAGARALACALVWAIPWPIPLAAQVPPDEAWRTLTTEHFRVTFPERLEPLGRRAAERAEQAWSQLSGAFVPPPSGRVDLLLTDHTDVSNGFAQVRPSNRMTIYARPPADDPGLGYFDDWMELVITHELAHVFHLDRAGALGRLLRGVFGRAPAQWPFFPGVALPRWTTEGIATWYESRLTHAGRTEGTYHEMLLRTAALEGRFEELDQASGDSPVWPGGTRAYAYGSLFFEHLLAKHGEERMGAFAEAVAGQWVPYRLDAAGRRAFGASLSEEWRLWTEEETRRARALEAEAARWGPPTPVERLTRGARLAWYPRVSRDGTALAWASGDGRSDAQLRTMAPGGGARASRTRTNGLASFDWMPDGAILFSQLEHQDPYRTWGDLYVAGPDGAVHRLTRAARLEYPSVAPGGAWAVAVREGEGTNALARVDLATGAVTDLVSPDLDVHWAYPAVSPDGRWIAATRWTPGARLDVVVLDLDGRVALTVTDDRAMDLAPAWTPDGSTLLWGSDRSGIPNILAARVDPAAGRVGEVRMATRLLTGAAYPAVDPGGAWLYYSGYHADGWDVERTPLDPASWPPAPAPDARFDAPPRPAAVQQAGATGRVAPYSPFPTLLPTYWEPIYREPERTAVARSGDHVVPSREVLAPAFGLQTSGLDLVGRHAWTAFARFRSVGERFDAGASWDYARLGNPVVSVGASQFWDEDGPRVAQREEGAPLDDLYVIERSRGVLASATVLRNRWRSALSLTLSGGMSWEHRELLDDELKPSATYRLSRPERRFGDLRATLSFTTARSYAFQVGAANGVSALVRVRSKPELSLADSLAGVPQRDGSVDDVVAQVRAFRSLGGPGFAAHVVALRASAGAARGPGADQGSYEVGGAAGSTENVTGLSLFGGHALTFPVRGYGTATRYGKLAWSASGEYRFPLGLVNRGVGAWPLHVDRLMGTLFADGGNAWGPELGLPGFQNPRQATLASVGAEVTSELLALWIVPTRLRTGVAIPLVEGDGAVFYVRVGLSF